MERLSENQQIVLKQFIDRAGKLIENGYAYAFSHPEINKTLQCESNKIQEIEKLFNERPMPCYEKMLRDIYIRYFVMLTKLGLKYANHHPDFYKDVVQLQSFFKEYDCMKDTQKNHVFDNKTYRKDPPQMDLDDSEDSTEKAFLTTYQQLNTLINKVDTMKNRIGALNNKSRNIKQKCVIKKSQDGMKILNMELKEKLRKIKREKTSRIRYYEGKDSDEISSEEILNFDDFNHTPSPLKPARVGPIQRNIVIPLKKNYDDEQPKIAPKYFFKRDDNGKMTFDVKLNFENGLLYNDRLVDGIYIENILPANTQRIKRNLFMER